MSDDSSLFAKLVKTSSQTGCYLLKNEKGTILYIGKAKNLKQRIRQHLQTNQEENGKFLGSIADWEVILTNNVKEALILEQNLIRKYSPRFNILLKDDHSYPYIKIKWNVNPRYLLVRNIPLNYQKEEMYFGPFPDGSKANEILQVLERLFPLDKCPGNLSKPCLSYSLKQCSGHCFQKVNPEYYQKAKKNILAFFHSKSQTVKKKIQASLNNSIANQEFELAKKEKKILDNLNFFTSQQNIIFPDQRNYDFLAFYQENNFLVIFFFIYRYGRLSTTKEKVFKVYENLIEKEEIIFTYLYQFYRKNPPPDVVYLSEKIKEEGEILSEKFGFLFKTPKRGRKKEILELAQKNAYQVWQRNFRHDFSKVDKVKILKDLGKCLKVNTPYFIEALDVSNLFQKNVVAGFLVFINGEIFRNKSKLYQLNNEEEKSDVFWIAQACERHYKGKRKSLPDLIIVDGGKPQVQSVLNALKKLNVQIPVIGLAKNEKHQTEKIITNDLRSLNFEKNETIKLFLTNLQDEVHRYVINFHRKLHLRSSLN